MSGLVYLSLLMPFAYNGCEFGFERGEGSNHVVDAMLFWKDIPLSPNSVAGRFELDSYKAGTSTKNYNMVLNFRTDSTWWFDAERLVDSTGLTGRRGRFTILGRDSIVMTYEGDSLAPGVFWSRLRGFEGKRCLYFQYISGFDFMNSARDASWAYCNYPR